MNLQVGKIRLPLLIDGRGLVCELAGGLDDDEGRTGDQIVGLEKPVNRAFADKIALGIGEGHSQLARAQFRPVQRQRDQAVSHGIGDLVPHPPR